MLFVIVFLYLSFFLESDYEVIILQENSESSHIKVWRKIWRQNKLMKFIDETVLHLK